MRGLHFSLATCAILLACSSSSEPSTSHIPMADLVNTTWQAKLPVTIYDTLNLPHSCTAKFPLSMIPSGFTVPDTLLTGTEDVYATCPGQDSVHWQFSGMGLIVFERGDTIVLQRVNTSPFGWVLPQTEHRLIGAVDQFYFPSGALVLTR